VWWVVLKRSRGLTRSRRVLAISIVSGRILREGKGMRKNDTSVTSRGGRRNKVIKSRGASRPITRGTKHGMVNHGTYAGS